MLGKLIVSLFVLMGIWLLTSFVVFLISGWFGVVGSMAWLLTLSGVLVGLFVVLVFTIPSAMD